MRVIPVYPVYQIVTPAPVTYEETYVEAPAIVEPPIVIMPEPTPEVYIEPERSVYTPEPHHWPEPETPVPSWTPLRK